MSLTGGISFFKNSKALFKDGSVATASSNDALAKNILADNTSIGWFSDGSDDTTIETIVITMPSKVDLDRLFALGHNWKEFTIKYHDGISFVDFTTVIGLNGALGGGIAETVFALDAAYYEFDKVNTDMIEITITKTQVVDEEKFLDRFFATEELGTFEGYPLAVPKYMNNEVAQKVLSSKFNIQKSIPTEEINMSFKSYPVQADYDLIEGLFDGNDPFFVWLCGGRFGEPFFVIDIKGFDLKDLFLMQTKGKFNPKYFKNIYINGFDAKIKLVSSI